MRPALPAALLAAATLGLSACGSSGGSSAASSSGAVAVKAGDSSCDVSRTDLPAGTHRFAITNTGAKTTEVYLYAQGDRIVAEKENIGPGLSYELTAQVQPGSYVVACKPGMTGAGIRTPVTVNGASAAPTADPGSAQAVTAYRTFVQGQVDAAVPLVARLAAAVNSGDVAAAKAAYAPSRAPWEAVEPVAEAFGDLDPRIDAREADVSPGDPWTGWHRIEKGLWVDGSTAGLAPVAGQLAADVGEVQRRVATAELTPVAIANGAKELVDEVATRKVTGEEEVHSHTDLVDLSGNLEGAREAVAVLRPQLDRTAPELGPQLDRAFAAVDTALARYRTGAGWVSYATVDDAGRRELSRVVDALGAPLSQLAAAVSR